VSLCERLVPRPQVVVITGQLTATRAAEFSRRCEVLPKPATIGALVHVLELEERNVMSVFAQLHGLSPRETEALRHLLRNAPMEATSDDVPLKRSSFRTYKRRIAGKLGLEGESGIVQHFLSWLTDPASCPHTELEGVLRQSQPPPPPTSWTPRPETIEAE
jgi:DNA-binding CsgD family transcriptional regulator